MEKDDKIYVAGNTGLVGSAIVRKLKSEGYNNLVFTTWPEYDLRNQQQVEDFFRKEKPEYVFLAAAKVGGIMANSTYPAEFIYDNLMIATNVIHASHKHGVKKLLNLGSSCIYPKHAPQPLKEEYLLTGPLEPTNEPYAIAKIAAIKLCNYYNIQYGTNFLSVMPTNLYGTGDNFDLETSHVLSAMIRKIHLAKFLDEENFDVIRRDIKKRPLREAEEKNIDNAEVIDILEIYGIISKNKSNTKTIIKLWGTGYPRREFLYVDDLADALLFLMKNYTENQYINVGVGRDIIIKELAELVKEILEFSGEIKWDESKPDGTPQKLLDVSKINTLGWKELTSLKQGIKNTYNWYLESICL